jgi:hypothetical protein
MVGVLSHDHSVFLDQLNIGFGRRERISDNLVPGFLDPSNNAAYSDNHHLQDCIKQTQVIDLPDLHP